MDEVKFAIGMTFADAREFKDVTNYAVAVGDQISFSRNEKAKVCVVCAVGCP